MKLFRYLIPTIFLLFNYTLSVGQSQAKELIQEVVEAVGGIEKLRSMKDVEYEYTFRSKEKGIQDVSTERYIFNGELSFAKYYTREYYVLPDQKGELIQYFNGKETVSTINGNKITEQQPVYVGHFFRKTNFYWFNMLYKLLDPGINYSLLEDREVDGIRYKIVEMTFDTGVGETSDKYVFYINPRTKLIDQFLFTVLGFGFSEPFLMQMRYEDINGLKLSTYRQYAPANWDGEVIKQEWNEQISSNIKFDNGFDATSIRN